MRFLILSVSGLILAVAPAGAQPITYTRIANTMTPIPDGTGNFTFFTFPVISNGVVAFHGAGSGSQEGIYTSTGGAPTTAYNQQTPIPGGTGNFSFLSLPSLSGAAMTFIGAGTGGQVGVYTNVGGPLLAAANLNTPIPGGTGNFTNFGAETGTPVVQGTGVAYGAFGSGGQMGIYRWTGGVNSLVANTSTAQPGGTGPFTTLSDPAISGPTVAFFGSAPKPGGGFQAGLYVSSGGAPTTAVDTTIAVPGGSGNFGAFGAPSLTGQSVVFAALDGAGNKGLYSSTGGVVSLLYNVNSPVPGGTGTFTDFGDEVSVDGANVAFFGVDSAGVPGIFADLGGGLIKVIDANTQLDGHNIIALSLGLSTNQLSGNQVAFFASLDGGGGFGVYTATIVPEPSSLALIAAGAVAWRWRKQRISAR